MSITAPNNKAPQAMGEEVATTGTVLRRAAWVAGVSAVAMAVYQVATPGPPSGTYESWSDYLRELLTLAYLGGSIVAVGAARRTHLASRAAARLVMIGYSLIAAGVVIGLGLREDPDWFFVLGGPGLLLSGVGFVIFAISARRRSLLPPWAAVLLGVGGFFALFLAEIGTSVLIGSFWLYVAAGRPGRTTAPT